MSETQPTATSAVRVAGWSGLSTMVLRLGGTQLNAIDFALAVQGHGYRSVLYGPLETVPNSGPSLFDVAQEKGVELKGFWRSPTVIPTGAQALPRRARAIRADLVNVHGAYGDPRSAYWGPCLMGWRPLIHTVYEMWVDARGFQHDSLIVGTAYLRDELVQRPGPTTISPPVDTVSNSLNCVLRDQVRAKLGELGRRRLVTIISRLDLQMKSFPVEVAIRAMRAEPEHSLAASIRALLENDALCARLGHFGRTFAIESFGLEAMATKLADVYSSALDAYGMTAWVRGFRREAPLLGGHLRARFPIGRRRR